MHDFTEAGAPRMARRLPKLLLEEYDRTPEEGPHASLHVSKGCNLPRRDLSALKHVRPWAIWHQDEGQLWWILRWSPYSFGHTTHD